MSLSDPIADMLTRIRNGLHIGARQVNVRMTGVCRSIAAVLKEEGYIEDFDGIEDGKQGVLRVTLKYDPEGHPIIGRITRVSRPGRRIYSSVEDLPYVMSGMGIAVISTSKGVMSDRNCRQAKIGGEVLCTVS